MLAHDYVLSLLVADLCRVSHLHLKSHEVTQADSRPSVCQSRESSNGDTAHLMILREKLGLLLH